jgi:hypothetical protein
MHEVFHLVEHTLGLCGEKHLSLLAFINEWPSISYAITYLKLKLHVLQQMV